MISVIIPVYNRENTVRQAIESVLMQTVRDIEVIVVDDGSTDASEKVIKSILDKRLRYVKQENSGACIARNKGIKIAKGQYIAFHDSDDIWHKRKLEKQIEIFKKYNPDVVFCKLNQIRNNGLVIQMPQKVKEGFLNPIVNLFGIGTQTIIAKKEVLQEFTFDSSLPRFQEFELLYRISQKYSIYCLNEGLVDYYIGDDSISRNPERLYQACEIISNKHPELKMKYPAMASTIADNLQMAGNKLRQSGGIEYKKYFRKSFEYDASLKSIMKSILLCMNLYDFYLKKKNVFRKGK